MRRLIFPALVTSGICVGLLWAASFGVGPVIVVRENQALIVLRFGEVVKVLDKPGPSWRLPVIDSVITYDAKLQYLNAEPLEKLAKGGEKLIIDFYAVWKLSDAHAFRRTYPRGFAQAQRRIQETLNSLVGAKIGGLTRAQLLARSEIISRLDEEADRELGSTGVDIIDVRLNRIELPRAAEPAAYSQMREQRRATSRELRAVGERRAREIRANADRNAQLTLAGARGQAEVTRGLGDAESARIYAQAYRQDPEFYAFLRSLEAYRATLKSRTTMVLRPDHEFFRFLDPRVSLEGAPPPASEP
ncbi:MAG: protease modulator HflC [Myxococcota bacterium]|nr:protease modulator HflC [Myxococcota bacterium]